MSSVSLILSGQMQSWGTVAIGHARNTLPYPTKSGVVGLIANAMGLDYEDNLSRFKGLSFGTRVDQRGFVEKDFQTVKIMTKPTKSDFTIRTTERFYLSDAIFLTVVNHDDDELIKKISESLRRPARALYLGRKACLPSRPVFGAYHQEDDWVHILESHKWVGVHAAAEEIKVDVYRDPVNEKEGMLSDVVQDNPISFSEESHKYASRGVYHYQIPIVTGIDASPKLHPALALAEGFN